MIVEMRTYKTKPGKRSEFIEIFRSKSMPADAEIGMKILDPFLSVEDPDTFFFMRGFPDILSVENILMPMPENLLKWGLA
jgi:heme-degrading monooxygenase HmoA